MSKRVYKKPIFWFFIKRAGEGNYFNKTIAETEGQAWANFLFRVPKLKLEDRNNFIIDKGRLVPQKQSSRQGDLFQGF